ncbi:MAG: MiaB/RimO family radical SAM methylthiotransferase, partial [Patescibacteria group bacterium]
VDNMCSIRQSAVDRIDGLMNKINKVKKVRSILTGCILKNDFKKLKKYFNFILPIRTLETWPALLKEKQFFYYPDQRNHNFNKKFKSDYLNTIPKNQNSHSALIPISSGCNNFCTYCVVPHTRGPLICRPHQDIIKEVKKIIQNGGKEVWLLGQNVNDYKSGKVDFPKLLKLINDIDGNFWIRFTSPHPKNFSDKLIKTMVACKKYKHYLNLPIQSGDNQILKKMNRPYTVTQYKNLVKKIKKNIPDISLSTDVIIGFANETKKQFKNTLKLLEEIKYDMAYFAVYSPRPQTVGLKLKNSLSKSEKEKRYKSLTKIIKETALENNKKYIGQTTEVLINEAKKGLLIGKTDTYKTVIFEGKKNLVGQFVKVKISKITPFGLKGILML